MEGIMREEKERDEGGVRKKGGDVGIKGREKEG